MILCAVTGTVRGQAKKINVSIPRKTGKSTIVTHGTIREMSFCFSTVKLAVISDCNNSSRSLKHFIMKPFGLSGEIDLKVKSYQGTLLKWVDLW